MKEAVRIARDNLTELFTDKELRDLALEDVELAHDQQAWHVTFSHARKLDGMEGFGGVQRRCYRQLRVAAEDGKVLAMLRREHPGDE
ncbi:MAG: hypothetical protein ACOCXA_03605 [Planctomycetota bacterium]